MDNVCALILYNNQGAKFGTVVDEYPVKPKKIVIEFDPAYLEDRLGVKVPLDEAKGFWKGWGLLSRSDLDVGLWQCRLIVLT